jgi:hypothetical protein
MAMRCKCIITTKEKTMSRNLASNDGIRHPFLEVRAGKPFNNYIKMGPFTLHESNKGSYFLYTVCVTGGIEIHKEASRPSFYDLCVSLKHAYNIEKITKKVFQEYYEKCLIHFAEHPELYPKVRTEKCNTVGHVKEKVATASKKPVRSKH